jgi:phosphoglycerate kinase
LRASGTDFGDSENRKLEKSSTVFEKARSILSMYKGKVILPSDLAIQQEGRRVDQPISKGLAGAVVKDIGRETCQEYSRIISRSKTVVSSGPLGAFEEKGFDLGSKTVLEAMASRRRTYGKLCNDVRAGSAPLSR